MVIASALRAQLQPVDSLSLWVSFTETKINIDIPRRNFTYRTKLSYLPDFINLRMVNAFVPPLPDDSALCFMISGQLKNSLHSGFKEEQLKYLGKICLLLFYSGNNLSYISSDIQQELDTLASNSSVKKEALLVKNWIREINL